MLDAENSSGRDASAYTDLSNFELTSPALFELDYIAPPAALSSYVTTLYHLRCEERKFRDIQPASVGHLVIFAQGSGELLFHNGRRAPSYKVNLLTPFSMAVPFEIDGPIHAMGAALSPLGWAALTGLNAQQHSNWLYRASDYLGPKAEYAGMEAIKAYQSGEKSGEECALALCDFIASNLKPVNSRHQELIKQTQNWLGGDLDPELSDLYAKLAYSERQAQRLIERYFGLAPRALQRKYRALRAAGLMSLPMLSPEFEAQLGAAFYDQSHMIREIRLFVGRTPARLSDDDSPYLNEMLDLKNFREIDPGS